MKSMRKLTILAGAMLVMAIGVQKGQADPVITGSVDMSGSLTLGPGALGDSFNTSTEITSFADTYVTGGSGTYAAGPSGPTQTPVAWNMTGNPPLSFQNGPQNIANLWSFSAIINDTLTTFAFDLTSISSYTVDAGDDMAMLAGDGTLDATGYQSTAGSFTLLFTDSKGGTSDQATFGFDAFDTGAGVPSSVPDGGLTIALLGGSLIALQVVRRKFQS